MRGFAAIGLINTKTPYNVGGAMRAAACYDAKLIVVQGKRYKNSAEDTPKAWKHTPLIHTQDNLFGLIPKECIPVAVEINENSTDITNFIHPERAIYIFGPEDGSVPKKIIDKCKHTIQIPTKYCMNLAATVNVVLYDRLLKSKNKQTQLQS